MFLPHGQTSRRRVRRGDEDGARRGGSGEERRAEEIFAGWGPQGRTGAWGRGRRRKAEEERIGGEEEQKRWSMEWYGLPGPGRKGGAEEQAASRVSTRITFAWSPWPPGTPQIIPLTLQCTLTSSLHAPQSSHGLPSIRA